MAEEGEKLTWTVWIFFFFLFSCAFKLICLFALKHTLQVALLSMLPILMNTVFSWFPVGILQSTLGTPLILVLTFLDIPVLSYCAIHITLARITSWWVSSSIFIPDHLQFTDYNWLFFFFFHLVFTLFNALFPMSPSNIYFFSPVLYITFLHCPRQHRFLHMIQWCQVPRRE